MMQQGFAGVRRYKKVGVETASPGQILLALYATAIRFSQAAADAIRAGNVAAKAKAIGRTSAIVAELTSTLDRDAAPELVDQLESLYFYMQDRLAWANAKMEPEAAEEVAQLLRTLHEGWSQAVAEVEAKGKEK